MHRTLKRVALSFDAPLNQPWQGYINPYVESITCTVCDGEGYNPETRKIAQEYYDHEGFGVRWTYIYGIGRDGLPATQPPWMIKGDCLAWYHSITQDEVEALVSKGRLMELTHTWTSANGWQPKKWETKGFWCPVCHISVPQLSPKHHRGICTECDQNMELLDGDDARLHIPWAQEVNEWSYHGLGHDGINRWILIETRAKRLGVWGYCSTCNGEGSIPNPDHEERARALAWNEFEPPKGEGWQLWETVSEGSPITPVLPTAKELASWCEEHEITIQPEVTLNRSEWLSLFTKEQVEDASMMIFSTNTTS